MNTKNGLLIVIEGADGVGTTTQSKRLHQYLCAQHPETRPLWTAEPSMSRIGQFLRVLLSENVSLQSSSLAALFVADRTEHYALEITPALSAGRWVVCDRGWQSTLVYQGLSEPSPHTDDIARWIVQMHQHLPPVWSYCCVLDVPLDVSRARRLARGLPVQKFEDDETQTRVIEAYKRLPSWDWTCEVLACNDLSVDEVHEMIKTKLARFLVKRTNA